MKKSHKPNLYITVTVPSSFHNGHNQNETHSLVKDSVVSLVVALNDV